ncbi:hypothetical protein L596_030589 [Steinernema carpocapsae]|uniref:Uncharacterized protein n=1 Tax=Steinernema carpocapsae TaxID=34508 RepID=A0A4U5LPV6_STECR|nr:hypothetical protein L596_030589 [Steinernema carpocapsae]
MARKNRLSSENIKKACEETRETVEHVSAPASRSEEQNLPKMRTKTRVEQSKAKSNLNVKSKVSQADVSVSSGKKNQSKNPYLKKRNQTRQQALNKFTEPMSDCESCSQYSTTAYRSLFCGTLSCNEEWSEDECCEPLQSKTSKSTQHQSSKALQLTEADLGWLRVSRGDYTVWKKTFPPFEFTADMDDKHEDELHPCLRPSSSFYYPCYCGLIEEAKEKEAKLRAYEEEDEMEAEEVEDQLMDKKKEKRLEAMTKFEARIKEKVQGGNITEAIRHGQRLRQLMKSVKPDR